MDDPVWDVPVFTKNRQRLMAVVASQDLLAAVLAEAASPICRAKSTSRWTAR